ncbi:MAG: anti-sigma factor [Bryobacterales bacterium]|nr:anti-sigma factor [Bryobacterales bacterium]
MNCDELRDHYDLYALGIAEEPERTEIRAHLDRGCEVCMAGVRDSLRVAALIGASAEQTQPSAQLRRRILASIGAEDQAVAPSTVQPRPGWLPGWAAALAIAALAIIAVYFAVNSRQYAREAAQLRQEAAVLSEAGARLRGQLRDQTAEVARLTQAFAIISGPRTAEASFGGGQPRPPQGKVFVNPARGVLFIASNLPRTAADKIYEMWLIPKGKGAKPIPAGLFQSQANGNALHIRPGTVNIAATAAVAVTLENRAGAAQPTSTPFIVAPLPATP